jgi:hypothetical protein
VLALRIRSEDTSRWCLSDLASAFDEWLKEINVPANVQYLPTTRAIRIRHQNIVWWCLVVEELVKNYRRYQGVDTPSVVIDAGNGPTEVYVGRSIDSAFRGGNVVWQPYAELWLSGRNPKGGGARLLENAAELASIEVEYSEVASTTEPQMVVRVRDQGGHDE